MKICYACQELDIIARSSDVKERLTFKAWIATKWWLDIPRFQKFRTFKAWIPTKWWVNLFGFFASINTCCHCNTIFQFSRRSCYWFHSMYLQKQRWNWYWRTLWEFVFTSFTNTIWIFVKVFQTQQKGLEYGVSEIVSKMKLYAISSFLPHSFQHTSKFIFFCVSFSLCCKWEDSKMGPKKPEKKLIFLLRCGHKI